MGKYPKVYVIILNYNGWVDTIECLESVLGNDYPNYQVIVVDNNSPNNSMEYIKAWAKGKLDVWVKSDHPLRHLSFPPVKKPISYVYYTREEAERGGVLEYERDLEGKIPEGIKRAYKKGYDWLWLMDDDAEPVEDSLKKLEKFFNEKKVVALASSVLLTNGQVAYNHRGSVNLGSIFPLIQKPIPFKKYKKLKVEIDMASFVGILVSRRAIDKVDFPKKEFFIHHDDVEYCIRLRKVGKILLIPDSKIIHKEAAKKGIPKVFLGRKSIRIPYEKFWLTYYGKRNLVWLGKKYSTNKLNFYLGFIKSLSRSILGVLLFDDNKFKRTKFIINAYIDGLKDNFDNEKPRRILYGNKR